MPNTENTRGTNLSPLDYRCGRDWRPIGSRARRTAWLNAARAIADSLCVPDGSDTVANFGGGPSGEAVFFAHMSSELRSARYAEAAEAALERGRFMLPQLGHRHGLFNGFCGVAWAQMHVDETLRRAGERSVDSYEDIDTAVATVLSHPPEVAMFDLVMGIIGSGVYLLEREESPLQQVLLSRVAQILRDAATSDEYGTTWWRRADVMPPVMRDRYPAKFVDLGIAHGVIGVLQLLSQLRARPVDQAAVSALLRGAASWILAQEQLASNGSLFPTMAVPGQQNAGSRLAWCYGDLSVATGLFQAAHSITDASLVEHAIRIARQAALRPKELSGVRDAGLCHGAAGVAHLLNWMYQRTGELIFATQAAEWFDYALTMRVSSSAAGGVVSLQVDDNGRAEFVPDRGFLTGASGIGLALLSAATGRTPTWDRTLLLSSKC